jgi:GntP family gluconate:H+ symporter
MVEGLTAHLNPSAFNMALSFYYIMACLIGGVALMVLLSLKWRIHPFFALLIASFATGLALRLPMDEIITAAKDGFGNIMKSLGLIIILGTTLGLLLEHRGSTRVMAAYILKKTGEGRAALAMSLTGFFVGLPVFCDSGFIVLNGLIKPLSRRAGLPVLMLSITLATGLYSVHCLVPPHPGAAGAASLLKVDMGRLILTGIVIAFPAMLGGYAWTVFASKNLDSCVSPEEVAGPDFEGRPSVLKAFLPVIVPVLLIAIRSFLVTENVETSTWERVLLPLGDPVIALSFGVLLALPPLKEWRKGKVATVLQEAAEKAGGILVIIGGGGIFGAVLAAIKPGEHLSAVVHASHMSIFFPFLLTAVLKTAQGSSTVAILTAASIVSPLLPALGLTDAHGRLFCVLAMGAGSMVLSHANDAYFWVIVKFTGLDIKSVGRVYSPATFLMGVLSFLLILFIHTFFPSWS